jgi:hypothetical protein
VPGRVVVGLLVSQAKLNAVLAGKRDTVYCRYARYAREAKVTLLFFSAGGVNAEAGTVSGYRHRCRAGAPCEWLPVRRPFPAVIYDRCFGQSGRVEAAAVRTIAGDRGATVVNHLPKITKLQAFEALHGAPDVAAYLPYTVPLTADSLAQALKERDDLYIKPDALYKGQGIYRLTRRGSDWLIRTREEWGNASKWAACRCEARRALRRRLEPDTTYLIQEGLPLATYLGARFDFRSLVQKDGRGRWTVSAVVARLAPVGSVITSPRSGGQVASTGRVLRHAFGERWKQVLADLKAASLAIARRIDEGLGPCTELGLDMAVLQDGAVKLIEVNGKPLRVSLERLEDPLVRERINRLPIHHAAGLAGARPLRRKPQDAVRPVFGMLLSGDVLALLHGPMRERYQRLQHEALEAGLQPLCFAIDGVDIRTGRVVGWADQEGQWSPVTTEIPDVIYHRATYPTREERQRVSALLRELEVQHGTTLLNSANSISKSLVTEALGFFPDTADLAPASVPYSGNDSLWAMIDAHHGVIVKKDHGSHGSDVLAVGPVAGGWEVRGSAGGKPVAEVFGQFNMLADFLALVQEGEPWIIQQRIGLPQIDDRPFDLRAILQKDGRGLWQVPLLLVRHARPGSIAANMSQGATPHLPEAFLAQFGRQVPGCARMVETASRAALQTAAALESRFGRLGELGIDIGLDREGRPWIFEANTKPLHPMVPGMWERLTLLPCRYAAHLAARARRGRQTGLPL